MTRATGRLGRRAGPPPGSTDPLAAGSPIGRVGRWPPARWPRFPSPCLGVWRHRGTRRQHAEQHGLGDDGHGDEGHGRLGAEPSSSRATKANTSDPRFLGPNQPTIHPGVTVARHRSWPGQRGHAQAGEAEGGEAEDGIREAWGWPTQHVRGADGTEGREDAAKAEQRLEVPRPLARVDIHSVAAPGVRDPQGPLPLGRAGLELLQVAARARDDHRRSTVGPFLAVPVPALTLDLRIGIPPGCRWHSLKPLLVLPAAPLPRLLPGPTLVGPLINGRPRHAHSRSIGPRTSRSADATRGERRRGGRCGVVDVDDSLIGAMSRA